MTYRTAKCVLITWRAIVSPLWFPVLALDIAAQIVVILGYCCNDFINWERKTMIWFVWDRKFLQPAITAYRRGIEEERNRAWLTKKLRGGGKL